MRPVKASFVNRLLVAAGGNLGFRYLLSSLARSRDPRRFLGGLYRPRRWKLLASPPATAIVRAPRPTRDADARGSTKAFYGAVADHAEASPLSNPSPNTTPASNAPMSHRTSPSPSPSSGRR